MKSSPKQTTPANPTNVVRMGELPQERPLHLVAKKVAASLGAKNFRLYFRTSDGDAFEWQASVETKPDTPGMVVRKEDATTLFAKAKESNGVQVLNAKAVENAGIAKIRPRYVFLGCAIEVDTGLEGFVVFQATAQPRVRTDIKRRLEPLISIMTETLRQRREAFSALHMTAIFLDAATDGVGIACPVTLKTLYVNPAVRRMTGIGDDVPLDKIHPYICRPGVLATERDRILREVQEHGSWVGETVLATVQGEAMPVSEMVVKFPFAGSPSGWALGAIIRDRRREVDQDRLLGRTKTLVESLAEIGPQAFYVWDLQRNTMTAGGDKVAALYGHSLDEIEAMPEGWASLVHPEDLPVMIEQMRRLEKAGINTVVSKQLRIKHSKGHWETINVSLRPLERDGGGKLKTCVGLTQVITNYIAPMEKYRKRADLYGQMVDEAGDSIFLFNEKGEILYANRHAEKVLGYRKDELSGKSLWKVFDIPRKGPIPRDLAGMKKSSTPRVSCSQNCKDGNSFNADLRMRRLAQNRYLGIARDLSREAELAEANQRQAAYYRGLFQNNISGVVVFDEKQTLTATNHALVNLLKYSQKELLGKKLIELVPEEHQHAAREIFNRMQRDRRFNSLFSKGVQLTLKRKDGRYVYVQAALSAISDGVVLFSQGIAIFTDITEELLIRKERDEQARFTEALVDEAPTCIVVMDAKGKIMRVNPAVEELTGFSARKLVGKSIWDSGLIDPDQEAASNARFRDLLSGEQRVNATLRIFTKAGGAKTVAAQSTAVRSPTGEVSCIVTTAMDVTEKKRLEAEVIKTAEAEQRRIGHDLHDGVGQVLTGIMALTEALECQLTGPQLSEATRIRELVKEAIQQVRQLSHGLSPGAVKLRGLAGSLRLLADRLRNNLLDCQCHFEIEPKLKDSEMETHIFRIAQEAINNSVRHGKPRHIAIFLRPGKGDQALMEIQDDGVGLGAKKRRQREGIGIRVMRYRADLIAGEFSIGPREGGGTTVLCSFPCVP